MRRFFVSLILIALAASVYYRSLDAPGMKSNTRKREKGPEHRKGAAVPVEVVKVTRGPIEKSVLVTGQVEAARSSRVSARLSGFLSMVMVRKGDVVSGGRTVLATLDAAELVLEQARARAALRVAEATLREKEASLSEAERQLTRERALFDQKVSSREALDSARLLRETAKAARQLARAQVDKALAELQLAALRKERTTVLAPYDGVISARFLDGGEQVTPSTPIVSMVDISSVRINAQVTESDYASLLPCRARGRPVRARVFPPASSRVLAGTLCRLAPVFDPATGTASVEVDVGNEEHILLPGMFVRLVLVIEKKEAALLLPVEALVERKGETGVFLVESGGARFVVPVLGIRSRDKVQVLSGLKEGDVLAATGNHMLSDGSRVRLVGAVPATR